MWDGKGTAAVMGAAVMDLADMGTALAVLRTPTGITATGSGRFNPEDDLSPGSAPQVGGEPVAGDGGGGHGERRREQGVPAGARDQHRRHHQQAGGQRAGDRL